MKLLLVDDDVSGEKKRREKGFRKQWSTIVLNNSSAPGFSLFPRRGRGSTAGFDIVTRDKVTLEIDTSIFLFFQCFQSGGKQFRLKRSFKTMPRHLLTDGQLDNSVPLPSFFLSFFFFFLSR